jgi:hypothetical protein
MVMASLVLDLTIAGTIELSARALQRGEPVAYENRLQMDIGASAIPSSRRGCTGDIGPGKHHDFRHVPQGS